MSLTIESETFYDAGRKLFKLAEDLHSAADRARTDLTKSAVMAGSFEAGKAWGGSYDNAARESLHTAASLIDALHNYGAVLTRSGFNYDSAEYDATIDGAKPPTMPPIPSPPSALRTELASAIGGHSDGLIDAVLGLGSAIGMPVPNGDTDKLGAAGSAWRALGSSQLPSLHDVADAFLDIDAPDVDYVDHDLRELATAIEDLRASWRDIESACVEYQRATSEIRETVTGFVEDLVVELAVDVAISVASSFISLGAAAGVGIVKAGLAVTKFGHLIAVAIGGWKTEKRIAEGVKDVRELKRAKETAERLKGLSKDGQRAPEAREPRLDAAPPSIKELPRFEGTKFRDSESLETHFDKHGGQFDASTDEEYVRKARNFLDDAQANGFPAKIDQRGRIRIYDSATQTLGVYEQDGTIVTYFKPMPKPDDYWNRRSPEWGDDVHWGN